MLCFIVIITEFLLAADVDASSTENCNVIVSNTCFQQCSDMSCKCGVTSGDSQYAMCNQACDDSKCKTMTCSSGTCYQRCHNCHMECTSEVGYCRQQCLSGACSFTCNAKRCVQECNGKKCKQVTPVTCRRIFQRSGYLVVLAGLFAATAILTMLALVLSFREMNYWNRRATYSKIRSVSASVDSLYSLESTVSWKKAKSFLTFKKLHWSLLQSMWKFIATLERDNQQLRTVTWQLVTSLVVLNSSVTVCRFVIVNRLVTVQSL